MPNNQTMNLSHKDLLDGLFLRCNSDFTDEAIFKGYLSKLLASSVKSVG